MKKLFFIFLALSACSNKNELFTAKWQKGDDIRQLHFLNEIEMPVNKPQIILQEKIEFTEQVYKGVRVENSFIKKINLASGELISVQAAYMEKDKKIQKLNFDDFILNEKIKEKIRVQYPEVSEKDIDSAEALIDNQKKLVWKILYFDEQGAPIELRLDKNLKLLSREVVGCNHFDKSAVIYPMGPKLSTLKEVFMKELSFKPALSNQQFQITSQISGTFNEADRLLQFPPDDPKFDQLQAYYYIDQTLSWIDKNLNLKLQSPLNVELHLGAPQKTNAAFYYQGKIRFGSGDDVSYSKIPQDPSIVSHEVFHAVVEQLARLPYEQEGGSLNEAFADYFATDYLNRPYLGENAYLVGPFKRNVDNTKKWSDKSGALYGDSLIISGLLYELRQKIGAEKIRKVALRTLSHLTPISTFVDFNVEAKKSLSEFLSSQEQQKALEIFEQRGFPK